MRRLTLLLAGAALWLFLAAIPALADGGPHVANVNSGSSTLTADSCAGCHRAHTAQGEFLLAATSEEALCLSCHGAGIAGATTNVEDGVQYVPTGAGLRTSTLLGALRDGGFVNARIAADAPSRMAYIRGYENSPVNTEYAISQRPKVGVGASEPVKSAHIDLSVSSGDGIADTGTVWGKGTTGLGTPSVTMTCVECHNPHGNDQYRILRPVPGIEADPLGQPVPVNVKATYTNWDTIVTASQHALVVNDVVTLTGVGGLADGDYFVTTVTNGFTFKVASSFGGTALNLTDTTGAGSVIRSEVAIADYPVDPDANGAVDTKNYTVIQTKGSQGVNSTYLLYAADVLAALGGTGVAAAQTAVTIDNAVTVSGTTYLQTTGVAHGVAVGDLVTITGTPGGVAAGTYTVGAVSSSGSVYDRFTLVGQTLTAGATTGTVARNGIAGDYSASGGDYFRRLVPWNPALVNPACNNAVYSTANSANCGTANDAPNGRPGTIGASPSALAGQQAFLDQMSTWCSQCHTRYYSASNENDGSHPIISQLADIPISGLTTDFIQSDNLTPATATSGRYGGPSYGDRVEFAGTGTGLDTNPAGGWWVIETGSNSTFKVASTKAGAAFDITTAFTDGTFTKVYQSSNSSWGYPRDDATYKYQHSTASNRGCTVCHVSHGSNAEMNNANGTTFSLDMPYPDGTTTSTSSRLLKVDNRGTCQMCHDPTGTVTEGTLLGPVQSVP